MSINNYTERKCKLVRWTYSSSSPLSSLLHAASSLGSFFSFMVQWCSGAVVQWCSGAVVQWCSGAVVQWCSGAVVQWCSGAVVQWFSSSVVQ